MTSLIRSVLGLALAVALFVLLSGTAAAAPADDDGAVLQGTWTVQVEVQNPSPSFEDITGTWTYYFGEGCTVGEACEVTSDDRGVDGRDSTLTPTAEGFRWTEDVALDCFDAVTNEISTPHGADYRLVGTLAPAATQVRDGITYVTSLGGTVVETIEINAAGLATECTVAGSTSVTQRSVLDGTAVPLPEPPAGGISSEPMGVAPDDAETSGTLPEFLLPRSEVATASAVAVDEGRRSSVPGALTTPSDALDSVVDRLPGDALLVAALGLLIVFPAQIFNSTYEENHERIERAFRRRPGRTQGPDKVANATGRARRISTFAGCAVVGTLIGGLLDPEFGPNRSTVALLIGVFVALLVAVVVVAGAGWLFRTARHRPHEWYLRAIPSALVVAVVCVLVSRLTHFSPGYLFGLLGGAVFVAALETRTEGRAEAITLMAVLGLALVSWVGFAQVVSRANEPDPWFGILVADALLGCLFIGGIEGLLFSLIPLRFLPGYRVRQWGWVPWAALTLVTTYLFVHVLLVPESGYLGRSTAVSATVTVGLFAAFGVASCLFWAWFRFRPDPAQPPPAPLEPVGPAQAEMAVPA